MVLKIVGYDDHTDSLLVAFASDQNLKTVDEYPAFAFQPQHMVQDDKNIPEVLKSIAIRGIDIAQNQFIQETFVVDQTKKEMYTNLIGTTYNYSAQELNSCIEAQQEQIASTQPISEGTQTL